MQSQTDIAPQTANGANTPSKTLWKENAAVYALLALFAALLGAVTLKHDVYVDEAQAWLIARQSSSLLALFQHLRYEGHPALWFLLIYLPAHLSANLAWMLGINYVLTVAMAWLILSDRRLPLMTRTLIAFSVSIFFYMGVIARCYMLAGVLLVAAARCMSGRRRHWLAMALLGLAINTHFFAIPVAAGIFVWLYWLAPDPSWSAAANKLKQRQFQLSAAFLAVALALCYFTLRPAPDMYTPGYVLPGATPLSYLLLGLGTVSYRFVPFPLDDFAASVQSLLPVWTPPYLVAASFTTGLWLLAVAALPSRLSRWFTISVSLLWFAAAWATVHAPLPHHATLIFATYAIALTMNPSHSGDRPWIPTHYAQLFLLILFSLQTSLSLRCALEQWSRPFSGAKPTADFLLRAGLTRRPFVIEPDYAGPALLAYTGIDSAYYPTCHCRGSFVVWRKGRDEFRQVTLQELQAVRRDLGAPPIVVSNWKLNDDSLHQLGLRLLYTSPEGWYWKYGNLFVYDSNGSADGGNTPSKSNGTPKTEPPATRPSG